MQTTVEFSSLVRAAAIGSNLPLAPRQDPDPAELGNGCHEGLPEGTLARGEVVHGRPRPRVREQHLVGAEETLPLLKVLEVGIVEGARRGRVDRDRKVGVRANRAQLPQLHRIRGV